MFIDFIFSVSIFDADRLIDTLISDPIGAHIENENGNGEKIRVCIENEHGNCEENEILKMKCVQEY